MKDRERLLPMVVNAASALPSKIYNWPLSDYLRLDIARAVAGHFSAPESGQYNLAFSKSENPFTANYHAKDPELLNDSSTDAAVLVRLVYEAIKNVSEHSSVPSREERWGDYFAGAALAIDPFPVSPLPEFIQSDRMALSSDWMKVQSDFSAVWEALMTAHKTLEAHSHGEQRTKVQRDRLSASQGNTVE